MQSNTSLLAVVAPVFFVGCAGSPESVPDTASADYTADATVKFGADSWEPRWSDHVQAGGTLTIDYDFNRLTQCRNEGRVVSWVMEVQYRFDGGTVGTLALPGSPGASETADSIQIPDSAQSVELWFHNHAVGSYDSCDAYDSDYGANYVHEVSK